MELLHWIAAGDFFLSHHDIRGLDGERGYGFGDSHPRPQGSHKGVTKILRKSPGLLRQPSHHGKLRACVSFSGPLLGEQESLQPSTSGWLGGPSKDRPGLTHRRCLLSGRDRGGVMMNQRGSVLVGAPGAPHFLKGIGEVKELQYQCSASGGRVMV